MAPPLPALSIAPFPLGFRSKGQRPKRKKGARVECFPSYVSEKIFDPGPFTLLLLLNVGKRVGDDGVPLRRPEAGLHFPLSPYRLLSLSWRSNAPAKGRIKRETVESTNRHLAEQAERFLYSHVQHKAVSRLFDLVGKKRAIWAYLKTGEYAQTVVEKGRFQ